MAGQIRHRLQRPPLTQGVAEQIISVAGPHGSPVREDVGEGRIELRHHHRIKKRATRRDQ
ncbi:hypothetical protein AL755_15845 [Arthrobacter sp. ERGS1:01]|nr:hypothetical protein AL755_15845 [Arthrobacter sp. ERGS1:01]